METTVSEILKDSAAVLVFQQLKTALEDEARRREEFREWLTEDVKAEFINGEIFLHSPVKRGHLRASRRLAKLLDTYVVSNHLGETSTEKALIALTRNDYEPDIAFWGNEKAAAFNDDTMLHPAPDFVIEILSPSTKKNDRKIKFEDYALHGIREYWIIDPAKQTVEQFGLLTPTDKTYLPYGKFAPGNDIKSLVLPDFEIPVAAIFDERANFEALKELMK
jgi:Uma2 family endonuclease